MNIKMTIIGFSLFCSTMSFAEIAPPSNGPKHIQCTVNLLKSGADPDLDFTLIISEMYGNKLSTPSAIKLVPTSELLIAGRIYTAELPLESNHEKRVYLSATIGNAADNHDLSGLSKITVINNTEIKVEICNLEGKIN